MIDREKVLAVLRRRFPGALEMDTAAAANAIVGLEDEWREVECTDLRDSSIVSAKAASSGVSSVSDLPIDPTNPRASAPFCCYPPTDLRRITHLTALGLLTLQPNVVTLPVAR
jgi:hypothetical protein